MRQLKQKCLGNSHLFFCSDLNVMLDSYRQSLKRDLFELLKGPALSKNELIKLDPEKEEIDIKRVKHKIIKL